MLCTCSSTFCICFLLYIQATSYKVWSLLSVKGCCYGIWISCYHNSLYFRHKISVKTIFVGKIFAQIKPNKILLHENNFTRSGHWLKSHSECVIELIEMACCSKKKILSLFAYENIFTWKTLITVIRIRVVQFADSECGVDIVQKTTFKRRPQT